METKLKHVAILQAETKRELLMKLNSAVDEYQIEIIHYDIERTIDIVDGFPTELYQMELFFSGPMIFSYDFNGVERIVSKFKTGSQSRDR